MKWIFLAFLMVFTPAAAAYLRANQRYLTHACFLLPMVIFLGGRYASASPIFWLWPGPVQGIQVTLEDGLAVAMLFSTPAVRIPLALKGAFAVLLAGIFVSSFSAQQTMPVLFYVWQLVRTVLVFVAIARVTARHEKAPMALAAGIGCAMIIEALFVIHQSAGGNTDGGGTLGTRNLLGMTSHFATMPAFALLLAGYRKRLATLVVFCGVVVALLGGSRATIGLLALGMLITAIFSMRHKMTSRKKAITAAAAALVICLSPLMLLSVNRRSDAELQSSNAERSAMIQAARMIIADYPMGVGANQYTVVANTGGYSARAGVPWNYADRSAPVHNTYFLITAELGFIGLVGLLAVFAVVLATGWNALRSGVGERSELLVGFLATVLILAVHIAFEWVFELIPVQYLTACAFGSVIGIASTLRASNRLPLPRRASGQPASLVAEQA